MGNFASLIRPFQKQSAADERTYVDEETKTTDDVDTVSYLNMYVFMNVRK